MTCNGVLTPSSKNNPPKLVTPGFPLMGGIGGHPPSIPCFFFEFPTPHQNQCPPPPPPMRQPHPLKNEAPHPQLKNTLPPHPIEK